MVKLVFCLAVVGAGLFLYANIVGIPGFISHRILAHLNRGGLAIEAGPVRLLGLQHVQITDVTVYRKKVLGPPMAEAALVDVELNLLAWLRGNTGVVSVYAENAVWRPEKGKSNMPHVPWALKRPLNVRVKLKDCRVRGVVVDHAECVVAGVGQTLEVNGLVVSVSRDGLDGRMTGQLSYELAERVLSGCIVTSLDPLILVPLVESSGVQFFTKLISRFVFNGPPPRGEWRFDRRMSEKSDIHLTGDFRMRDCSYRGVDLLRADGMITVDRRGEVFDVEMNNLFVVRPEGMANVAFAVDPRERQVEFSVESSLRPLAMARMVGVLTNLFTQHVVFEGPSRVVGKGVIDYGESYAATDLKGVVQADDVSVKQLHCDRGSCDVRMLGRSISLTNMVASAYDGSATGSLELTIPHRGGAPAAVRYRTALAFQDVSFGRFIAHVAQRKVKQDYEGELLGEIALAGSFGEAYQKSMNGLGRIEIRNGRVFLMPLFGGLSSFMTKAIPGLDFVLRQSDARSVFRIENGRLKSDKIVVEGGVLSLRGDGTYVMGGDLDFNVQMTLMKEHSLVAKLVRVLTFPISKLFEFRVRGSLKDPTWYPVNFSLDVLRIIGLRRRDANADEDRENDAAKGDEPDVDAEGGE